MNESKASKVDWLIRRAVRDSIAELAINNPQSAEWLRGNRSFLEHDVANRISGDRYRMKELADIMAWKQGPRRE